jgi:hypothetical protein
LTEDLQGRGLGKTLLLVARLYAAELARGQGASEMGTALPNRMGTELWCHKSVRALQLYASLGPNQVSILKDTRPLSTKLPKSKGDPSDPSELKSPLQTQLDRLYDLAARVQVGEGGASTRLSKLQDTFQVEFKNIATSEEPMVGALRDYVTTTLKKESSAGGSTSASAAGPSTSGSKGPSE